MPNSLGNRVKMSVSGTPGTGTITLGSAVSGFQTFADAGIANAATVPYVIEDGTLWEIGVGTYTSSGTTLARTTVTKSYDGSTLGTNKISATSSAIVMISPLAADLIAAAYLASGTSGGIPYFDSASSLASSAALAANSLVKGGGAGAAPSTITTGTGVITAIGNAVNAASGLAALDSSGNLTVNSVAEIGYGTGSGGTVTQATSKSTAVTLNKPTGQITMNNAALAASTTVGFVLNNTVISNPDAVVVAVQSGAADYSAYNVWSANMGGGGVRIFVRNVSGGSLSEAIVLNFCIIKGATS
jgi:hypothetical protein